MKIKRIEIQNIKSFKNKTEIEFNDDFNILIGPNGSGKSNLLDILTICIRQYFLKPYSIVEGNDNQGYYKNINNIVNPYGNIKQFLEKFYSNSNESIISIDFIIKKEDIENIKYIKENIISLENKLSDYRNGTTYQQIINNIKQWEHSIFQENMILSYTIKEYNVIQPQNKSKEKYFLEYLNYFEFLLILIRNMPNINIHTNYLYFSPYRGANLQNLQANLSSKSFYQVLQSLTNATSKTVFSLISLATIYFAEKRRSFEDSATNEGYQTLWKNDEEVKLVTKYLKKLGYNWDLKLVNKNKNIYEIILTKEGKEFYINQASSGEKEIINFLLGIFSFNLNNGIIIIDEPEIHLHPKWQNVLLDLFIELSKITKNQFILSTHSPIFINDKSYNHIFRIYKNSENISNCKILKDLEEFSLKDILHIINSTNNEKIFFADIVIFVEGITDRLIFQKILNNRLQNNNATKIIEIVEIKGKTNIDNFKAFLNKLEIPNYFIADLDFINEIGNEQIKLLFEVNKKKIKNDVIKNPKSKDGDELVNKIESALTLNDCSQINDIWEYIKSFRRKLKPNLTNNEQEILKNFIKEKQQEGIYILEKGDIEDYFPEQFQRKDLNNTLALVEESFDTWKESDDYKELDKIIDDILKKNGIDT